MEKFKIYGSDLCQECHDIRRNLDRHNLAYEFVDITKNLSDMRYLLKLRDTRSEFDAAKKLEYIGIPAMVFEDGRVVVEWEDFLRAEGYDLDV